MRKLFFLVAIVFITCSLHAQVHLNLNFNVESQPVWGPTGYDHVEYYYFPDIEAYYNVPKHMFYYNYQGRWIERAQLPSRYHSFDFYKSYKVVVNERAPYRNHLKYRDQYSSYRGRHDQQPIRDSRDERYYVNRNHPEHNNWMKQQKHDNGRGNGKEGYNSKGNNNGRGNGEGNDNGRGNKQDKNNRQDKHGKKDKR